MRHLTRASVGLVAGFALLSGCSSLGGLVPGGATSTAASASPAAGACAELGSVLSEASATLNTVIQEAGSKPKKAMKTLNAFTDSLTKAIAKVDDPALKKQAGKVLDAVNELIPLLEAGMNDPSKLGEAVAAVSNVQKEVAALGALCAG